MLVILSYSYIMLLMYYNVSNIMLVIFLGLPTYNEGHKEKPININF